MNTLGALRRRRQKECRRRRHGERRNVMLRQVVAIESRGVSLFHELQPLCIELLHRSLPPVYPIEHAEIYSRHYSLLYFPLFCASQTLLAIFSCFTQGMGVS